ncbi:hypothetical protein [Sandaracinus amylolyticus]|uniref:Putative membrane protein n=1 Tax=Sandaracinus amylolyticus TaxID=927083 RepID=A0A0F6W9R6_9BACT|nr:hypothetical protein [Sandaracinus amylolyticus]AKF11017.1 putative membrane protein [Sandaracinus amylolyticus]
MHASTEEWLRYFRDNRDRPALPVPAPITGLEPALHRALVRALQCLHLGEAGEGRLAVEILRVRDPALDAALRETVVLYVAEEGRHAREVAQLLGALGARTLTGHHSELGFRALRRSAGHRTKMLTLAAAEVVGLAFYEVLASHFPHAPAVAHLGRVIAREETAHLAMQRFYFERVAAGSRAKRRVIHAAFRTIVGAGVATLTFDQRALLRALAVTPRDFALRCAEITRTFTRAA